jgi:hypothetical protein
MTLILQCLQLHDPHNSRRTGHPDIACIGANVKPTLVVLLGPGESLQPAKVEAVPSDCFDWPLSSGGWVVHQRRKRGAITQATRVRTTAGGSALSVVGPNNHMGWKRLCPKQLPRTWSCLIKKQARTSPMLCFWAGTPPLPRRD